MCPAGSVDRYTMCFVELQVIDLEALSPRPVKKSALVELQSQRTGSAKAGSAGLWLRRRVWGDTDRIRCGLSAPMKRPKTQNKHSYELLR